MMLPKLIFLSWFVHAKAKHCHKFTKGKKCKHGRPYWIWMHSFVLTTGNVGRGYGSWQAAEIQITQAHAGRVHFEQHTRCHRSLSLLVGPVDSPAGKFLPIQGEFRCPHEIKPLFLLITWRHTVSYSKSGMKLCYWQIKQWLQLVFISNSDVILYSDINNSQTRRRI